MKKKLLRVVLISTSILLLQTLNMNDTLASQLKSKKNYILCWTPISSKDKNNLKNTTRTRAAYTEVLMSLDVEHNYRYEPKAIVSINGKQTYIPYTEYTFWKNKLSNMKFLYKETYCNIYVRDVCSLLGCDLPDMRSNDLFTWFKSAKEWNNVSYTQAMTNANKGLPTVMVMSNSGGVGHIAMVRPTIDSTMLLSQAGRVCSAGLLWQDKKSSNIKYYTYSR